MSITTLKNLLSGEPNQEKWDDFCEAITKSYQKDPEKIEKCLPLLLNELKPWNKHLRQPAFEWIEDLMEEIITPLFQLVTWCEIESEFNPEGLITLAESPFSSNLRGLVIAESELDEESICALANSPWFAGLEFLALDWCDLTDEGITQIASSSTLTNLKTLHLKEHELTNRGLKTLFQSPNIKNLTQLTFGVLESGRPIDDDGVVLISQSAFLGALKELDLSYNEITDKGAKALADSRSLPNLKELDLSQNMIGTEGVMALARTDKFKLEELSVCSNYVEEIEELKEFEFIEGLDEQDV